MDHADNSDGLRDLPMSPYHQTLGITSLRSGGGRAEAVLVLGEPHLRTLKIAHGGLLASLLDTATGLAASSQLPEDHYAVTAQLNCNFIRPAWSGETLMATGQVVHRGRRTAVSNGEIRTSDGALVATATATILYIPHDGPSRDLIVKK